MDNEKMIFVLNLSYTLKLCTLMVVSKNQCHTSKVSAKWNHAYSCTYKYDNLDYKL
jgi:hypothetical protein